MKGKVTKKYVVNANTLSTSNAGEKISAVKLPCGFATVRLPSKTQKTAKPRKSKSFPD